MKKKNFLFRPWAICIIAVFSYGLAFAQQKPTNPDGVELPDWVLDWQVRYNLQLLSNADIDLYENFDYYVCEQNRHKSAIVKIERNKKETLVTLKTEIYWDWNWLFQDKETCLIDNETGDRYMLRTILGVHEPGRMSAVYGLKGKSVLRTLVFPPLKKDVKVVDFLERNNFTDAPREHNSGGYHECGIVLEEYTKYQNAEVIY
jgi:hypothetical protein